MNENRYSPPSARVADPSAPLVDPMASSALEMATRCLWLSLAFGVVNSALQWSYLTGTAPTIVVIGILAFTFALLGWLTYSISRGKNWARIILLIMAIIGLPSLAQLPAVFSRSLLAGALSFVQSMLQFAALYMVFATSARWAFSKRRQ